MLRVAHAHQLTFCDVVQNRVEPPEEPEQRPEAGAAPPATPEPAQEQHGDGSGAGEPATPPTPQTPNLNRPSHRLAVRLSGCCDADEHLTIEHVLTNECQAKLALECSSNVDRDSLCAAVISCWTSQGSVVSSTVLTRLYMRYCRWLEGWGATARS